MSSLVYKLSIAVHPLLTDIERLSGYTGPVSSSAGLELPVVVLAVLGWNWLELKQGSEAENLFKNKELRGCVGPNQPLFQSNPTVQTLTI